jgi:hypothetical protein
VGGLLISLQVAGVAPPGADISGGWRGLAREVLVEDTAVALVAEVVFDCGMLGVARHGNGGKARAWGALRFGRVGKFSGGTVYR